MATSSRKRSPSEPVNAFLDTPDHADDVERVSFGFGHHHVPEEKQYSTRLERTDCRMDVLRAFLGAGREVELACRLALWILHVLVLLNFVFSSVAVLWSSLIRCIESENFRHAGRDLGHTTNLSLMNTCACGNHCSHKGQECSSSGGACATRGWRRRNNGLPGRASGEKEDQLRSCFDSSKIHVCLIDA